MKAVLLLSGLVAMTGISPGHAAGTETPVSQAVKVARTTIAWRDWSDQAFADARAQKKYVLLDLGAVWCHWCHVMDATTYHDPKVIRLIRDHFIPVRVDQDANPELSRRYEAFGWPATIVMDADGNDIGRMRGYREPARFAVVLQAILDDPSPLRNAAEADRDRVFNADGGLAPTNRAGLETRFREALDTKTGGTLQAQRFLGRDSVEYGMALAMRGDPAAEAWSRLTLRSARALIDPVWGGMYQYSTDGDWRHPHYEKIMEVQANAIILYARAYRLWGDPADLAAALAVRRFVADFLTSPDGAFYTSQDADRIPGEQGDDYFRLDDAGRRARGIPRVDTHVYARENGWMIEALVELYGATGDAAVLADAQRAARWIVGGRGNPDGGFRHDARNAGGPYFGDQLAMGRAMLALYSATGDRDWFARARGVRAMFSAFAAPNGGGYLQTPHRVGSTLKPVPHLDENVDAARFANLLHRYTGDAADLVAARTALRYVADADVTARFAILPGVLLAEDEVSGDPLHITIVGSKTDARALTLHRAGLRQGAAYRRIEWWDPTEGRLVNPDVEYPALGRPAAFVCNDRSCSLPMFDPGEIARHLAAQRERASVR